MAYQTINPATGDLIQKFDNITDAELDVVVGEAHEAFRTDWRHREVRGRAKVVARAAQALRDSADEYARYLTLEMGS